VIAPGIIGPNAQLSPLYERMVKRVARQKEGAPAFLCSERARYITGAVLTVTGGMDLFTFERANTSPGHTQGGGAHRCLP
jgi:NAD(P)-dependent dehydrogenase (short-subunit alcohol dehydrogenase family)